LVKEQSILPGTPTEHVQAITLTCQQWKHYTNY
jgi:hypothetical protein